MYNKCLEIWRSYACPQWNTGWFYVLHLSISLIGVVVGLVCSVMFLTNSSREWDIYAVWALISSLLAAALAFTHIAARYIPELVPPERLSQFAIIGGLGALGGFVGIFYHLGRAIFMTTFIRSQVLLGAWAVVTFIWGISLAAFAGYYRSQKEECIPIMQQQQQQEQQQQQQQQQQHDDDLRVGDMV